tara:strand:+ start:2240 stop:4627 length:2388 start_codon:yes stop_codon:yes gene_type:complete
MAVEKNTEPEENTEDTNEEKKEDLEVEVIETDEEVKPEEVVDAQQQLLQSFYKNVATDLDEQVLSRIANELVTDYKKDKESRGDWEKGYTSGLDLLGFKYNDEGQPFKGASGVTHPLLSEAVTQFQAQAYKELLPSDGPVRTQVVGEINFQREEQAQRVKEFMNYMLMDQMEEYTPDFDQLLFYLPLTGSAFKKVYFDDIMQRPVSKFVHAEDLVVPYYATDLKDCERITHVIKMSENELLKKQRNGFYRDVEIAPSQIDDDQIESKYQEIEGVSPSADKDYQFNILEMHVDLDLEEYAIEDAPKNVKVPYIVTIDEGSSQILSIYRNYQPFDETYKRKEYFVHFKFLPGLGFYGFGLIHMIGGLSKTATAALRQLLDAGTLSNLPAGFKSRGIRIRDEDQPFQPGEFRDVDAPGGNIKDQFQFLPFKGPDATLFSLLQYCVAAGQRFASIADMAIGNDTQNRAVGTTIALLERGSRVMSAIHKRCYYAMRQEFRLLAKVFSTYLPPLYPYAVYGGNRFVKVADFGEEVDVIPVADPNVFSMAQKVTLAQTQLQIAQSNPQIHNVREAYRRVYEALGTKQIDALLKPDEIPQPLDPAIENARALQMKVPKAFPLQSHDAHIMAHSAFVRTRMVQINPMVYALLQAHISEHLSFKARGQVLQIMEKMPEFQELAKVNMEAYQTYTESMVAERVAVLTAELQELERINNADKQDPLIQLKQQEIDLKAMDMQRKVGEFISESDRKSNEFEQKIDLEKMKREDAEASAQQRIRVADEKLDVARAKVLKELEREPKDER